MFQDGATIDLTLTPVGNDADQVRLRFFVVERADGQWSRLLDIRAALAADVRSDLASDLTPAQCQIIANELQAGLLDGQRVAAKKAPGKALHVELQAIGATISGTDDIGDTPSVAFAVAGHLAVVHGTGATDLFVDPSGGHGWRLAAFAVE